MPDVNYLAVLAAAVSAFVLGGLWYSPLMFSRPWQRLAGVSDEAIASGSPVVTFGVSFLLSLVAAAVFALFLGPDPAPAFAVGAGAAAGLGWVATSFGINYLFERRSPALLAINGGYHTLQFTLYGLILGLWH
jgi:hypothetical protein